jgi:hypothetical protein
LNPLLRTLCIISLLATLPAPAALALDHVIMRREGSEQEVIGQLLVKAEDGGLLLQSADGVLWTVPPDELVKHTTDGAGFKPLTLNETSKRLLKELPKGFEVHVTQHYLICYNTSQAYAQWCGALFERLYFAFTNYWSRKGFALKDPEFPLVALVFADRDSYTQYAQAELGAATKDIIGYYSLRSNRMTTYDLTGIEAFRQPGDRKGTTAQINQMLARPDAERTVATIIHEATHQIAFNCGLQTRYADIPLWVSEGIAVYFETPDLTSSKGWRNIGGVNQMRLQTFREYQQRRPPNSLESMLADDKRFRDPRLANDAYAEAWAFNYFLLRQHSKEYFAYLHVMAQKSRLIWDDPAARLAEFKQAFGDLQTLDAEFLRHMNKVQ